jgi:hypothetical protein
MGITPLKAGHFDDVAITFPCIISELYFRWGKIGCVNWSVVDRRLKCTRVVWLHSGRMVISIFMKLCQ